VLLRGQPNFKLKIADWFEARIEQKPNFIDLSEDTSMHLACKEDDL